MKELFGALFGGLPSGIGMQNYYAAKCHGCGKIMSVDADGKHEDEWDRGYCADCSRRRMAPAQPNYIGTQNYLSSPATSKPYSADETDGARKD